MTQSLTGVKHALYLIVALFSFILFIVACVVVPYERDTYGGSVPTISCFFLAFQSSHHICCPPLFLQI
jgi:hypothetical protein